MIIAAHPYRRRFLEEPAKQPEARVQMLERARKDYYFGLCDAIEGFNGPGELSNKTASLKIWGNCWAQR